MNNVSNEINFIIKKYLKKYIKEVSQKYNISKNELSDIFYIDDLREEDDKKQVNNLHQKNIKDLPTLLEFCKISQPKFNLI